jgi:hypothetical protein
LPYKYPKYISIQNSGEYNVTRATAWVAPKHCNAVKDSDWGNSKGAAFKDDVAIVPINPSEIGVSADQSCIKLLFYGTYKQ